MELNLLSILCVSLFRRFFIYSNFMDKYHRIIEFSHDTKFKFSIFFFFFLQYKKESRESGTFFKSFPVLEFCHFVMGKITSLIRIRYNKNFLLWNSSNLTFIKDHFLGKRDVRGTRNRAARHEFKYHSLTLYLPRNWTNAPHPRGYVKLFNTERFTNSKCLNKSGLKQKSCSILFLSRTKIFQQPQYYHFFFNKPNSSLKSKRIHWKIMIQSVGRIFLSNF